MIFSGSKDSITNGFGIIWKNDFTCCWLCFVMGEMGEEELLVVLWFVGGDYADLSGLCGFVNSRVVNS
jgi:hypothetical protein